MSLSWWVKYYFLTLFSFTKLQNCSGILPIRFTFYYLVKIEQIVLLFLQVTSCMAAEDTLFSFPLFSHPHVKIFVLF